MSNRLYAQLSWLPQPPADFAARCKALFEDPPVTGVGQALTRLASYALDENKLTRLAKLIGRLRAAGETFEPLVPVRLGIISNATADFIVPALVGTAARHGIALEVVAGDFNQVAQEALDPQSAINRARCDAVLLALDYRALPLPPTPGDPARTKASVEVALDQIMQWREGVRRHGGAVAILQTLPPPAEPLFGSFERVLAGTRRDMIARLNAELAGNIADSEDLLFDVASLAETVGLAEWHDPKQWNLAKLPFAADFVPLYAEHLCRLLAAQRGKSRRCLILDLDNTLWGGVIGDDGLDGIQLAQGDATGEAHLDLQRVTLELRARGIVLAVSSKNDDAVARRPFREHPEMLLKEDHIAVFQANWKDKASNIKAIAEALSLGLDAMVFVDDNPMERDLVRTMLPQVAVPEMPDDPALYARTLLAAGYFESIAFSAEDRQRADMYQDNARRLALQEQAGDIDAYLRSLDMEITFQPFDETGRARISQLINKSNQFNLTTRRYSEADVAQMIRDRDILTLQIRLSDVFGDNGMICVIICRPSETESRAWDIDTWLMSCRVLGRKVEETVLAEIVGAARERGIERLIGTYKPSGRNAMVEGHYARLGFTELERNTDGSTRWSLDVAGAPELDIPMRIRRPSLATA